MNEIKWESNQYGDTSVAEITKSLFTLCKYNNGFFKTDKQAHFLKHGKTLAHIWGIRSDSMKENDKDYFGVDYLPSDHCMQFEGVCHFGERGTGKGYRRIIYYFVMDNLGIKRYYRLGIQYYSDSSGSGVDASKTKLVWERQ